MAKERKFPVPAEDEIVWHQSGVNRKGEPFVQVLRGKQIVWQMTPHEARRHAAAILEAAEAAEQDAFMLEFAQKQLGLPFEHAGGLLVEFRKFRERTGKSQGPTRGEDWVMPKEGA